jgi:tetratricopeptide (TPR) repeat protein
LYKIEIYGIIIDEFREHPLVMSKAFLERAQLKNQIGKRDAAKLDIINLLLLEPNQPKAEFKIGVLYLDLSMPEKALQELLKALEISRNQYRNAFDSKAHHNAQCLNYVAVALMDLKRYTEAANYLQESIALNDWPHSTDETTYLDTARINLAICQMMQGYGFNNPNKNLDKEIQMSDFSQAK